MNIYYLLGGSFKDNNLIISDILKEKEINNVLFVDEANKEHEQNFNKFKEQWPNFASKAVLYKNSINTLKQFKNADLIYFNGGRTEMLMDIANKNEFMDILSNLDNKIYVGLSAGAIMFFKYGYGDKNIFLDNKDYYGFDFVRGLGIFEYIFCPHYQKEGILQFNQDIKKYNYSGYALTNGALLKIKNNHYQIIKEKGAEAFYLDKDNDYILKYIK